MSKELIHTFILIITIGLSFLFGKTKLANYDLQISALLFIILFISKRFINTAKFSYHDKKNIPGQSSKLLESVVFTFVILNIINSTGGVASPFFFLIYFLLFSLSLLLEPIISITVSLTLIIFFLFSLPQQQDLKVLLPIFSLAFLTPFALYMAQEHLKTQKLKMKTEKLEKNTFLFLSLIIKNHLTNIKEAVDNFMGDHELDKIKNQVKRMEKLIDKFENVHTGCEHEGTHRERI